MNGPSTGGKIEANNPNKTSSRKASSFLPNTSVIIEKTTLDEDAIKEMGYGGGLVGVCDPCALCYDNSLAFKSSEIPWYISSRNVYVSSWSSPWSVNSKKVATLIGASVHIIFFPSEEITTLLSGR